MPTYPPAPFAQSPPAPPAPPPPIPAAGYPLPPEFVPKFIDGIVLEPAPPYAYTFILLYIFTLPQFSPAYPSCPPSV